MTQIMSFSSPMTPRRFLVEDVIDDLHFEEVIAGAERAALFGAAVQGVIADLRRSAPSSRPSASVYSMSLGVASPRPRR